MEETTMATLYIVAVVGVVEKDGKVLLLKRAPHEKAFPNQYTLPGGKIEGETTPEETLIREMKEEAGIIVGEPITYICSRAFTRPDAIPVVSLTFRCRYISGDVSISKDFTEYIWARKEDLDALDMIPDIKRDLLRYIFK